MSNEESSPSPASQESPKPHSAEYFGETRDHWWNADFIALMARRWGLSGVRDVLDVGCGIGHWGRVLAPVLPPEARLTGVDREPSWIAEATKRAERAGLGGRFTYTQGVAEELPFADASFDMVTCQTVLIHVPDVPRVVREMLRVLRPGGLIVVAEPNNMSSSFSLGVELLECPFDELLALSAFDARCQRGKRALGLGDNSVGEQVPGIFAQLGVRDVRVYLNDRASPMIPPYDEPAMKAQRAESLEWIARGFYGWERSEAKRYFEAGGGTPEGFEAVWALAMARNERLREGLERGTYHQGGEGVTYLVSGRVR